MQNTLMNTNALASVPNSLRSQMERAENLLAQSERAASRGDHSLALIKAREGMRVLKVLAQSAPVHAALIIAGEMGHRGIMRETVQRVDQYKCVDKKFLGFTVGHEIVNTPTITTTREIYSFI